MRRGNLKPHLGGCWYCYHNDDTEEYVLEFSVEFDTWVHIKCIKDTNEKDPLDLECGILCREFKIPHKEIEESDYYDCDLEEH